MPRICYLLWMVAAVATAAIGESSSERVRPTSLPQFVAAFEVAFSNQDVEAASDLFYWKGLSPQAREHIMVLIRQDLRRGLKSVALLPADAVGHGNEGPTQPNLSVVGHLLAEFVDTSGDKHYSLHVLGVSNGVYYIALPVPVSRKEGSFNKVSI